MFPADLTLDDFERYFRKNKLGKLFLFEDSYENDFINLSDLFRAATGMVLSDYDLVNSRTPNTLSIIVYGPAIENLGYQIKEHQRREFFIFGKPKTISKRIKITTSKIYFLVITKEAETEITFPGRNLYYFGEETPHSKTPDIHIVRKNAKSIAFPDETLDGLCLFEQDQYLTERLIKLTNTYKRQILWDEKNGILNAVIK